MCGRYSLAIDPQTLAAIFGVIVPPSGMIVPRYNIAPTQTILVVRATQMAADPDPAAARRELVRMHWGFVPAWAADISMGAKMCNARSETARDKPAFRTAFKRRRALAPATGFYAWAEEHDGKRTRKAPHFIRRRGGAPFAFAALWECWTGGGESAFESCTILTAEANALVKPIHHRMPVIMPEEKHAAWLADSDAESLQQMLVPYEAGDMEEWAVTDFVNVPGREGEACTEPRRTASDLIHRDGLESPELF